MDFCRIAEKSCCAIQQQSVSETHKKIKNQIEDLTLDLQPRRPRRRERFDLSRRVMRYIGALSGAVSWEGSVLVMFPNVQQDVSLAEAAAEIQSLSSTLTAS